MISELLGIVLVDICRPMHLGEWTNTLHQFWIHDAHAANSNSIRGFTKPIWSMVQSISDVEAAKITVREELDHIQMIRSSIRANSNAICIIQNLAPPVEGMLAASTE